MTTQQLLALDLLLLVLSGALYAAGGILAATLDTTSGGGRRPALAALACAGLAVLVTAGRLVSVALLAGRGWWFAGDKVLLGLPLTILPAVLVGVVGLPVLGRAAGGRGGDNHFSGAAAALLTAAYASAAGVLVAFVVGYPVSVTSAVVVIGLVLGLSGLTWLALSRRHRPGLAAGFVIVGLAPILVTTAVAFYVDIQPVTVGAGTGHAHLAAGPATDDTEPAGSMSVSDLRTGPAGNETVRSFALTARQQVVTLPSGRTVDGWTFGSLPGPEIRVRQGDLVEVTVFNRDIADGVTAHWHGYPVPNGEDGVAGLTQDAIRPGESFTYRFVARDTGTYWYHAHQVSSEAVARGLFGSLVVEPAETGPATMDLAVPVHTIDGITILGSTDRIIAPAVTTGRPVRLRLINTDPVPHRISISGTPYVVSAVDGTALNEPTSISGRVLRIPAGGRYDVVLAVPAGQVAVAVEGAPDTGVWLDPAGGLPDGRAVFTDGADLDLLDYGSAASSPGTTDLPVDREATLVLDRQLRFLGGIPTFAQTINGQVYPHVPPIVVREGELVRLTVANRGAETHPMHPHGHRVLVQSRNGVPVRGSPLWLDTFDVQPGEVWQVLLRADNPGLWMAHCHNLQHATQGMVVHLIYEGVSTPFALGGSVGNRPE